MLLHHRVMAVFCMLLMSTPVWAQSRGFNPDVQRELDALKDEPSIKDAQRAALGFFNVDPRSVQAMRSRASMKGLMPSFEARYRMNQSNLDVDTRNTTIDSDPFLFDTVQGSVQEIQLGLRWDLPSLVFNAEVLDVGSLAILQESLLKEVTRLYYTRRRLQIDLILNPAKDPGTRISKELRIDELTSTLDAMTGELFSRAKEAKSQRRRRPKRRRGEPRRRNIDSGDTDLMRPVRSSDP